MHGSRPSSSRRPIQKLAAAFAVALGVFTLTSAAHATVKVTSVGNASRFTDLTNIYTVYGGLAGAMTAETGAPVNNCIGGVLEACNESRIYPNLILSISFTADKDGVPLMVSGGTSPQTVTPLNPTTNVVSKGTTITMNFRWGDVCLRMADSATSNTTSGAISATCEFANGRGAARADFKIGVSGAAVGGTADQTLSGTDDDSVTVTFVVSDSMGQTTGSNVSVVDVCENDPIGLCHFQVTAGDEKVVLKNLEGRQGFPLVSGTGVSFEKIRVLWQEVTGGDSATAFAAIRNNSPHADVDVTSDGTTITASPTRIEGGLKNDTTYAFKAALIDGTGNIGYFTATETSATSHIGDTYCAYSTDPTTTTCHVATPGEVVGVLSKDLNCFIATAAYGSPMAPQVETFRQFRDLYLKPTKWGAAFVRYYYDHSPKYATMIAHSHVLRAMSRTMLWPMLAFAALAVKIGAFPALFVVMALIALPIALYTNRRPRA